MITNIKESFKEMLQANEWMDDITKQAAMEKVLERLKRSSQGKVGSLKRAV
jgi:predicted metalloendopeptidase